jgi:hypothetical protein
MLGDLNVNLAAPCDKRHKTITKVVDTMALVDMSSHFSSTVRESIPGLMDVADEEGEMLDLLPVGLRLGAGNRPGTMVSACQRPKMPFCHNSDHRALVAETRAGGGGR